MRSLLLAAEKGNAEAQFNLGVFYDNRIDHNDRPTTGNDNCGQLFRVDSRASN